MSKDFCVVFTDIGARILKDPVTIEQIQGSVNVVINPGLHAVRGIPPHYWKLDHLRNVVPMTDDERKERDKSLSFHKDPMEIKFVTKEIPIIKEVEKIVERPVIETRTLEKTVEVVKYKHAVALYAVIALLAGSLTYVLAR